LANEGHLALADAPHDGQIADKPVDPRALMGSMLTDETADTLSHKYD
jgi:hypothetical protein